METAPVTKRFVVFLSQLREEPHNTDIQLAQMTMKMKEQAERDGFFWWSPKTEILGVDFQILLIDRRPLQFLRYREESLDLIKRAMRAAKKVGATDIGLGSLVASVSHSGQDLVEEADQLGLRLDHGDDMSMALAYSAAKKLGNLGLPLQRVCLGIVGAAGLMGAGFARLMASEVNSMVLVVRDPEDPKVTGLVDDLQRINQLLLVTISKDFTALRQGGCELIFTAHSSPESRILPEHVTPAAFVLDACIPPAVREEDFLGWPVSILPVGCGVLPKAIAPRGIGVDLGMGQDENNGRTTYGCMLGCILSASVLSTKHNIKSIDPPVSQYLLKQGALNGIAHQPFPQSEMAIAEKLRTLYIH
ncbi:MAG: hypothetical protein UT86_C0002G0103 [Candidatus Magasanikbacteria bacterium GW2011_GWC2_40_17]|uniref:Quinate/shikimate 5-dehydrogenase/glutamyl-tRNA reductase domain-containing protein n=1 Tax=Candidatus Magasanikbacteria bacterium GW2011_GWA2_42_32 TaxID=1619039 RepID=A0A0G1A8L3_9BACT|nr:MAG: hypothetical protein UT86_C0002G0103 [Candidatus Magasanikbacteria bacterium GW2011_GWC2_40_17]KKS57264.1 MAG: hypothetical protein UV20_C0002G0053 [Candidatus Magasanikbacteria bacterium GW2011_GWA2_42_32]OGH86153.1 MAG: hypothetical protein A2294_02775 [Candidatus Magasanikbacteria bacterium RIFOXYB2_FULL_38_10]